MQDRQPEHGPPLSQLLDGVEGRLDSIAGTLRYSIFLGVGHDRLITSPPHLVARPMPRCLYRFEQCYNNEKQPPNTGSIQIDDAILRISTILRKTRRIKNSLAPINHLPPETLAHITTFLATERDLINATAVCQQWRTALLSFPRLWRNAGGSSSEIQAYIERSKSTPIDVSLSSPELAELIVPHISRLVGLTARLDDSSSFSQIIERLRYPIPTLHTFRIFASAPQLYKLDSPLSHFFLYSKRLDTDGISVFRGPQTFPHVTEFTMHTSRYLPMSMNNFLRALEQLPALERAHITFNNHLFAELAPRVITLPHVREMSISAFGEVNICTQYILGFLQLPKLTSLRVQLPLLAPPHAGFPVATFGKLFPNLAELPELQVNVGMSSGEFTFRSHSQAALKYVTGPLSEYNSYKSLLWRELLLHSVRRLTVNVVLPPTGQEFEWLIGLLRDLKFLEHLELGGKCGLALRRLRRAMAQEAISLRIQTIGMRMMVRDEDEGSWWNGHRRSDSNPDSYGGAGGV